jgi:Flp pilus assembly protein TadD
MSEANALWARASELARTGEIRQAEKILTKLARIAPDNADIYGFHGTLKVQSGKHAQAVPLLKRALRLDDGNPTTHGSLAVAYEGLSKSDKAKTHYLRALELDPKQARTHMNLGSLYWQEGKRENAITHYEQAIDLDEEFGSGDAFSRPHRRCVAMRRDCRAARAVFRHGTFEFRPHIVGKRED